MSPIAEKSKESPDKSNKQFNQLLVMNMKEGRTENVTFLVNRPDGFPDEFQSGLVTNYISPQVSSMATCRQKPSEMAHENHANEKTESVNISVQQNQVESVESVTPIAHNSEILPILKMELILESGIGKSSTNKLSTVHEHVSKCEIQENEADRMRKRETFRRAF